MEVILWMAIFFLLGLAWITIINVVTAPRLAKRYPVTTYPLVSVLIPARNEAANIGACLEGLVKQDYPVLEILVLDDQSTDATHAIVQPFTRQDSRIQLFQGENLPSGWTGKNWACHQLSRLAKGEILIFTDADTTHHPAIVTHTVGWMERHRLGLLSAFPQQITRTWAEKLVTPVIDLLVFCSLPLWLTYYSRFPSMAAAIGQWLALRRSAYLKIGGHAQLSHKIVEDVEISREAKRQGIKILTTVGTDMIFCRMYHSFREVWAGYSKNFFGIFGYHLVILILVLTLFFITGILPYFLIGFSAVRDLALRAIGLNLVIRTLLASRFKYDVWWSVVGHPLSLILTGLIGINSYFKTKKGVVQWKDRQLRVVARG
ncbi:glycosyltransferase [candidate division KSB1 bacterium]|nr:glycosyltransferase [candidate division KSB1 bacterium]